MTRRFMEKESTSRGVIKQIHVCVRFAVGRRSAPPCPVEAYILSRAEVKRSRPAVKPRAGLAARCAESLRLFATGADRWVFKLLLTARLNGRVGAATMNPLLIHGGFFVSGCSRQ